MMLDLRTTLKELRKTKASPAVSVLVPTHRTFPDSEQDSIALKNQLKKAEDRLIQEHDKRTAAAIMELIHQKTDELDHNYNLDTLAIFATADEAKVLRLPFDAKERVIIGEKFATRDLMRHLSEAVSYYILVITSQSARLIEGLDNRVVKEFHTDSPRQSNTQELNFPIKNTTLPAGSKADLTGSSDDDRYLKEFFNRVDKSVQQLYRQKPLPVIVVGDNKNIHKYQQVCDNPNIILGLVDNLTNLQDGEPQSFVDGVQALVADKRTQRHEAVKGELEKARNDKMVRTDLQQIYRSALEGNAVTLLVRQGYSVPAIIDEDARTLLVQDDKTPEGVTDDAVSEIIEVVSHHGGEVVFIPQDSMPANEPIALITRY